MKVIHILEDTRWDGQRINVYIYAQHMLSLGHEVEFVVGNAGNMEKEFTELAPIWIFGEPVRWRSLPKTISYATAPP